MEKINTDSLVKLIAYKRKNLEEGKMPESAKRMLQREIEILICTYDEMKAEISHLSNIVSALTKEKETAVQRAAMLINHIVELSKLEKPISFSEAITKDEELRNVPSAIISRLMIYAQ